MTDVNLQANFLTVFQENMEIMRNMAGELDEESREIKKSAWSIVGMLETIGNLITNVETIVWKAVKSICESIISYVKGLATAIVNGLKSVLSCVGSFFSYCFS